VHLSISSIVIDSVRPNIFFIDGCQSINELDGLDERDQFDLI